MSHVTYRIVRHDSGWAYKLGETFSETYPSHDLARAGAVAAREQRVPDQTAMIEFEDGTGNWVTERADGHDRPLTDVTG